MSSLIPVLGTNGQPASESPAAPSSMPKIPVLGSDGAVDSAASAKVSSTYGGLFSAKALPSISAPSPLSPSLSSTEKPTLPASYSEATNFLKDGYEGVKYFAEAPAEERGQITTKAIDDFAKGTGNFLNDLGNLVLNHTAVPAVKAITGKTIAPSTGLDLRTDEEKQFEADTSTYNQSIQSFNEQANDLQDLGDKINNTRSSLDARDPAAVASFNAMIDQYNAKSDTLKSESDKLKSQNPPKAPAFNPASFAGNLVGSSLGYILGGEAMEPILGALEKSSPLLRIVGKTILNASLPAVMQQLSPVPAGQTRTSVFLKGLPSDLAFGLTSNIPGQVNQAISTGLSQLGIGKLQGVPAGQNIMNASVLTIFGLVNGGHPGASSETGIGRPDISTLEGLKQRAQEILNTPLGDNPDPQDKLVKAMAHEFLNSSPEDQKTFMTQAQTLVKRVWERYQNTPNKQGGFARLGFGSDGNPDMGDIMTKADEAEKTSQDKTVSAFNQSAEQKAVGKIGNEDVVLGSFGGNAIDRKTAGGQADRLPASELPKTLPYITEQYKAGDSSFRKDNLVHVAEMPDGEKRAVVTRRNPAGQEEVINFFKIGRNADVFTDNLKKFGVPERNRTSNLLVRTETPFPLGDGNAKSIDELDENVKSAHVDNEPFTGFKDLSTNVLNELEGKTTVSKQFISDLTNKAELKQTERDLVRSILTEYADGKPVPVKEFAEKVHSELLPLKRGNASKEYPQSGSYENISLPAESRGPIKKYAEHIYQSPVKNSAGYIHFGNHGNMADNYFGHTRVEDLPGNTRRVIEVQSDLYQKGGLESETKNRVARANENIPYNVKEEGLPAIEAKFKVAEDKAAKEVRQLEQYSNPTAHFRMVREEVKQAAKDGKTKLQFPTGETAMKIEGLGAGTNQWELKGGITAEPQDLKVGLEMKQAGQPWIITDVLGDGKFKAVPKRYYARQENGELGVHPDYESHNETFDISGKVDTNNPIYKFYEKDLGRYLKNTYGAERITDKQGVSWYEVPVKSEYAEKPVTAFKRGGTRPLNVSNEEMSKLLFKDIPKHQLGLIFDQDLMSRENLMGRYRGVRPAMRGVLKPMIELYTDGALTNAATGFHESYHYIFDNFLSKSEQAEALDAARREMGPLHDLAYKSAGYASEEERLEEFMADRYADEKTKENDFEQSPFREFFKKIDAVLKRIVDALKRVKANYDEIPNHEGGFVDFKKMFGIGEDDSVASEVKGGLSPSSASPEAQRTADLVREANAETANQGALESFKQKEYTKFFDKLSDDDNIANISSYERTGAFDKAPKGYSEMYKDTTDRSHAVLAEVYGEDRVGYVENYVRRQYDFGSKADEKKGVSILTNKIKSLSASKSNLKSRTLDMPLADALSTMKAAGIKVKPITANPETLRQWTVENARRAATYADTWQRLKDAKLITFLKPGERIPEGLVKLNDRVSEVMFPSDKGLVKAGQYFADKNVSRVLNNVVSRGLENSPTYRGIRSVSNSLNQFQLSLSAFHLTGTAINAGISDVALGLRDLATGNLDGATKIARGLVPGASVVRDVMAGNRLIQGLKNGNPIAAEFLKEKFNPAGGRLGVDQRYINNAYTKMRDAFKEGTVVGGIKGTVRIPQMLLEATSHPLMSYAIPRAKIGAFMDLAESITRRMPDATPEELKRAYADAWDSIDNRFGQLVYDNLFWNKAGRDLTMVATRSVGWNLGTLRELGGGVADAAKVAKGKPVTDRTMYAIVLPLYAGLIGALYMYAHTGKRPRTLKDYFYPQNGLTDKNGNPDRTSLPTYMKDIYAYSQNPLGTVEDKAAPWLSMAFELAQNRDYYGDMIRNTGDPVGTQLAQVGSYMLNEVSPFSISQAMKTFNETGGLNEQSAENFFGFTKAPASVSQSGEQANLLNIILQGNGGFAPRTPEQTEAGTQHQQAETLFDSLSKLPKDQANKQALAIKADDPSLYKALVGVISDNKLGLTYTDRLTKELGVANGERAKYIYEQAMKLPTATERNSYFKDLQTKKVVTPTVSDQIKALIDADGKGAAPVVQNGTQTTQSSVINKVVLYAKAIGTDPVTAFNRIFTGQTIKDVRNGAVIVDRMSFQDSTAVKKVGAIAQGVDMSGMNLDHTIPLEIGGSNSKSNLKLVTNAEWASYTPVEDFLGEELKDGKISKSSAQKLITDFKSGKITASDVYSYQ